ncbi:MAG TPA: sigma-70 family RNA polymerase sigma factor [Chitinophagaceae bacterium]
MTSGGENIDILIEGCKNDDRRAQELLYRKFYRALMSLCLLYTKNETDALEVLNTGFYKVFKSIGKYNAARSSFYTWSRTIIMNSCLDFIKAHAGKVVTGELDAAVNVDIAPGIISKISADEILQLVRQLSPATRVVFNLYVMEGYSHSEIASRLAISEGTSKWHLSEARKKLQTMINEQRRINE